MEEYDPLNPVRQHLIPCPCVLTNAKASQANQPPLSVMNTNNWDKIILDSSPVAAIRQAL